MRNTLMALALLAGCTALTTPAQALTIWTGTSQSVENPDTGEAERYTVSFTFDDSAPLAVFNETTFQGPLVSYQRAYYTNIVAFSVVGPRYSVSYGAGAASVSTLASARFRDGNAGMFVLAGADGTTPGFALGFTYFADPRFASTAMPTALDIAAAVENGFNLTEYFEVTDPDDPDAEPFIDSRERLNFRFASGGIVAAAAVPEPATWAMLIGGFGMLGGAMRRRVRTSVSYA